jgi:dimethylaniline monooxygenase (N-oxide forming)
VTLPQLVSSRQLTTFSDYRYTPDSPDFLSTTEYCTYLEGYVKHFQLQDYIHLSTVVTKVRPNIVSGHIIEYIKDGQTLEYACEAVAICSGLHVTPNIPVIEGIGNVPKVIHSSEFKERKDFGVDKHVMIVGSGETGMDIAYLAITSQTRTVTLCHRDGFLCAPKVISTLS